MTTTAARRQAATTVAALCRGAGLRVDVRVDAAGWVVRSPTGRSIVASSLTGLWAAVASVARLPAAFPAPALGAAPSVATGEHGSGPDAAAAPGTPRRRVAVVLGDPGRLLLGWATHLVLARSVDDDDRLDQALQGGRGERVVVACTSTTVLRHVLAVAVSPRLGRRCTVTAAVRCGSGPRWLDDVDALAAGACRDLLDGTLLDGTVIDGTVLDGTVIDGTVPEGLVPERCVPGGGVPQAEVCVRRHPGELPAVAAWLSGQVACGATDGRRVRAVVGRADGRVLLDVADGLGIAVRTLV